jgi:lysophospholipase L1-like esterase
MIRWFAIFALVLLPCVACADDKPILKKGDRLVIVGDSITEQKLYSRYIETYLTACHSELDLWVLQLGWGGETAGGFLGRMDSDLIAFRPNVVTTCYGMNDGGYRAFEKAIGDNYRKNLQ